MRNSNEEKMVIYTLRVKCVYMQDECIRVIEIPDVYSLHDLHEAILDAVEFDDDHLFEFYMAQNERSRKVRFTESNDWEYAEEDWHQIALYEVYPLQGLKLYYLFDFGDNWLFEIRKERKIKRPEAGVRYPRVIERIGANPEQYPTWDEEEDESSTLHEEESDSDDELKIEFETMAPSEMPPLNEHAQAILDALKKAGKALSKRQILKETGLLSVGWSNALALLMMHDMIEIGQCKKRGVVFSRKGWECAASEHLKEEEPSPPLDSLPFFGMESEIDWEGGKG